MAETTETNTQSSAAIMEQPTPITSQPSDQAADGLDELVGSDEGLVGSDDTGALGGATAGDVPDSPEPQAEVPAVEDKPATTEPAAAPTLDEYTLLRAQRAGLDADDAQKLQASGKLEKVLTAHDGHLIDQMLQKMQPPAQQEQPAAQPPTAPAQPTAPQQVASPDLSFKDEDWKDADGDTVLPSIRNNVERVAKVADARFGEVKQAFQQLMQEYVNPLVAELGVLRAERAAVQAKTFNDLIEKQGAEWQPIFGAGPSNKLPQGSTEAKARQELAQHIAALDAIERANGTARPADPTYLPELFQRALGAKHMDKLEKIAAAKVQAQVQGRRSQMMHPPTRRTTIEPKVDPDAEARAAVRAQLEAMGRPAQNRRQSAASLAEDEANLLP